MFKSIILRPILLGVVLTYSLEGEARELVYIGDSQAGKICVLDKKEAGASSEKATLLFYSDCEIEYVETFEGFGRRGHAFSVLEKAVVQMGDCEEIKIAAVPLDSKTSWKKLVKLYNKFGFFYDLQSNDRTRLGWMFRKKSSSSSSSSETMIEINDSDPRYGICFK